MEDYVIHCRRECCDYNRSVLSHKQPLPEREGRVVSRPRWTQPDVPKNIKRGKDAKVQWISSPLFVVVLRWFT